MIKIVLGAIIIFCFYKSKKLRKVEIYKDGADAGRMRLLYMEAEYIRLKMLSSVRKLRKSIDE